MDKKYTNFSKQDDRLRLMREAEFPGGVVVDPTPITAGAKVTVLYYGLLAESGADEVYLHTGYGPVNHWEDVYEYKMGRTTRGFEKTFNVNDPSRLNFCFRDSIGNWDNNGGNNWSFEIHTGQQQ
ncbi:MAG: carbohydrate-binding protein [Bacillota bacterium]